MQDLCLAINGAIDPIRECLVENQGILEDLGAMVEKGGLSAIDGSETDLKSLMERVAAARAVHVARGLGAAEKTSQPCEREEPVLESQV